MLQEEKQQQIFVAKAEIERKKQDLIANVIEPANARCYEISKEAEAEAFAVQADADASAETIRLEGEARASAQQMIGQAEADAMSKKAKAWGEYSKATFVDKIIAQLPEITKEVHRPTSYQYDIRTRTYTPGPACQAHLLDRASVPSVQCYNCVRQP